MYTYFFIIYKNIYLTFFTTQLRKKKYLLYFIIHKYKSMYFESEIRFDLIFTAYLIFWNVCTSISMYQLIIIKPISVSKTWSKDIKATRCLNLNNLVIEKRFCKISGRLWGPTDPNHLKQRLNTCPITYKCN